MLSNGFIVILLMVMLTPVLQFETNVYLRPNNSTWPTLCLVNKCYILEVLINNEALGELSNTTFLMLPGAHTIKSDTNKLVSITSITNFTLKAANLTAGATINCSGNIGFIFTNVSYVDIFGITFDHCGVSQYLNFSKNLETFALLFVYSYNTAIIAVSIKNGKGIGLLVQDVSGYFNLSQAVLTMNGINLNLVIEDPNINATVKIVDSVFSYGQMQSFFSSGIVLRLRIQNMSNYVQVNLSNVSAHQNINCSHCYNSNMYIEMYDCTTSIIINNYTSIYDSHVTQSKEGNYSNTGLKSGLFYPSYYCQPKSEFPLFILKTANFKKSGIYFWFETGFISTSILSNVNIENAYSAIEIYDAEGLMTVIFNNVSVKSSYNHGCEIINSEIIIEESFIYIMNSGAIVLFESTLILGDGSHINISHNVDDSTAALYAEDSLIEVCNNSNIVFNDNRGGYSGAILLMRDSHINLFGNPSMLFSDNRGKNGGAIAFLQESGISFSDGSANLLFINNHAINMGGAIYVDNVYNQYFIYLTDTWPHFLACMYLYGSSSVDTNAHPNLQFKHNTAIIAGNAIYGQWNQLPTQYLHFDDTVKDDLSMVSSDPLQICICIQSKPDCDIKHKTVQLFPGQIFEMEAVAVGKANGTVPSYINAAFIQPSTGALNLNEYVQSVKKVCSKLTFTIRSPQQTEVLQLSILSQTNSFSCIELTFGKQIFDISFIIYNCPIGFIYNTTVKECQCLKVLIQNGIQCDFNEMKVIQIRPKWITGWRLTNHTMSSDIIIHNHCPFDYCYFAKGSQLLDLLYPDEQCSSNRSGILCGACQTGFSHVLGTSKCKLCTKPWIILIIPLAAIAGIMLVVGLNLLNLTVTMGTINGLIFYANIVKANHAALFPSHKLSPLLSIFVAWLNLDLGIETCLYNGLDAYAKTWLQFAFPLYVWLMVIIIIVASHYSTKVSNLTGNDTIKVLATLFLLSYAKLLDTIITIFTSTVIVYPNGHHRKVWLYDGNIDYCKGKHVILFIAAIMILLFLSIPYTAVLLFIQMLQKFSHYKLLFFVAKLMPLFDAYTGPYKIKHRYWTGLLLLIRVLLFLIYSINTLGDPMMNLLATSVTMFCLFAYLSMIGGVYKIWWLNMIEVAFILNLGIFPTAVLYQTTTNSTVESITYVSTGIAFVLFIMIVILHIIKKIVASRIVKVIKPKLKRRQETDSISEQKPKITSTTIELWEPLMNSQ